MLPANNETTHKAAIRRENVDKILAAAERVFAEKGFKGASVGEIAELAGVPKPNIYYYFGTKEDLYRHVIEDVCEIWVQAADTFDTAESPEAAIRDYVIAKMDLARQRPYGSRLWAIEMASGAPFLKVYMEQTLKPWLESREQLLEGWVAEGKLSTLNIRHFFYMIWATTQKYADFEPQIRVINGGKALSDAEFDEAKKSVVQMVLRSAGL